MADRFRKTRERFETPGQLRFITCSCYHRRPFFNNDAIKQVFVDQLAKTQAAVPFALMAWVLMPEHFHLLIMPELPAHPVSKVLKHLKGGVANRVLRRWRQLDAPVLETIRDRRGKCHFWLPGGGYDRNIHTRDEAEEKFHYIHHNPVERGLVDVSAQWRWSSARWYEGLRDECPLRITPVEI